MLSLSLSTTPKDQWASIQDEAATPCSHVGYDAAVQKASFPEFIAWLEGVTPTSALGYYIGQPRTAPNIKGAS